ncbi:MAG: ATP/GTP-binding protein [Faecousia sp.]
MCRQQVLKPYREVDETRYILNLRLGEALLARILYGGIHIATQFLIDTATLHSNSGKVGVCTCAPVDKDAFIKYNPSVPSAMLVNFSYANFMAYLQPTEFSMVAGRFRTHRASLMEIPGEPYAKLLPITAIYGGNASGKSTFIHAMKCLRSIVLLGTVEHVEPHLFSPQGKTTPTTFKCAFATEGRVLEYQIDILGGKVVREVLNDTTKGRIRCIFDRCPGKPCSVGDDISAQCPEEELQYALKMGTALPDKEVFLTTIMKLQVAALLPAVTLCHRWFAETLCIIGVDSRRIGLGLDLLTQLSTYSSALADADTGVEKLQFHEVNVNIEDIVPPHILSDFRKSDHNVIVVPNDHSMLLVKEETGIKVIKCYSAYTAEDGTETIIPLAKESDGTRRYLHLLPILLDKRQDRVYLVDELDRSLHTMLAQSLIRNFRRTVESKERRLQLIFTTHDVILMEGNIFRKDEIWVTERDDVHQAHLISMAEYKDIRPDNQLRKSYLEGRMGGLPNMNCCV